MKPSATSSLPNGNQMNFLAKAMPKIQGSRCPTAGRRKTFAEAAFGAFGPGNSLHPLVKLRL
jgi:hypothetical protein